MEGKGKGKKSEEGEEGRYVGRRMRKGRGVEGLR